MALPTARPLGPSKTAAAFSICVFLLLLGLLVFFHGFFLTRYELPHTSDCLAPPAQVGDSAWAAEAAALAPADVFAPTKGCWLPSRRVDRVILLIVDALSVWICRLFFHQLRHPTSVLNVPPSRPTSQS